jgi:hypothetical protein
MIYEEKHGTSKDTKHSSISLQDLIKEHLRIDSIIKNEINLMMSYDPYFWKKVYLFLFKSNRDH